MCRIDSAQHTNVSAATRKPFRKSGLRKSFNPADGDNFGEGDDTSKTSVGNDPGEDDGPVVVRPAISRSSSLRQKKRPNKSSRLSFGGDGTDAGDGEPPEVFTPKKVTLGKRVLENSALRRGLSTSGLPLRSVGDDDDRPRYSKEYLEELQSSTPNTPQNVSTVHFDDTDAMDLDASELDGALVVDTSELTITKPPTTILAEAEIREKKERRARLAKQQNFISLEDDDDEEEEDGYLNKKKKDDTRLIAEDEDLGEGFDDYVEDGGLSLGKRAEKERRKRERQQMVEMINTAEGNDSDSSSDSDAERRIAYEAAQTRAGLDGLKKPRKDPAEELLQVPPKITPLPSLPECLARLHLSLKGMEEEMKSRNAQVERLRQEREEITKREGEVQALLDDTGRKYQEAMGHPKVEDGSIPTSATAAELTGERGLESLGTPKAKANGDEEL